MRQNPKNTVLAFLLIGISFIIFGWVFELLNLESVEIGISTETAESVIESVRQSHKMATVLYGGGLASILFACVGMLRLELCSHQPAE
ncbi:MAG: hypothetical protein AB8C13_04745 [Phycisphaerales bacterium]